MRGVSEFDMETPDGRTIHVYDTGASGDRDLVVFWHHGTPNTGAPPEPLLPTAARLRIRLVSFDRPGYGGSTPRPGRSVGSVADDVALVADRIGVRGFAAMGHSGGGPHALATAALLPDRVVAVVSMAGLAPFEADDLDWFRGMAVSGEASLRAAAAGRATKEQHERAHGADYDPEFTAGDLAALSGSWSWLNHVVEAGSRHGPAPLIDDDLAYVSPWGFDPGDIVAPTLVLHGTLDTVVPCTHGEWLAAHCSVAELRLCDGEGHISVLAHATAALTWLREQVG